jgi:hypothetical protein
MTSIRKAQIVGFISGIGSFVLIKNLWPLSSWWQTGLWQIVIQLSVVGAIYALLERRTIQKEVTEERAALAASRESEAVPVLQPCLMFTPAQAHVWIAVYAAEFAQRRKPFECITAADVAVYDLDLEGRR